MRHLLFATIAAAGAATASAQVDVVWYATPFDNTASNFEPNATANDPFRDVAFLSSADAALAGVQIGTQPISIAFDGLNVYLGGNVNGSPETVGVSEIHDFFSNTPDFRPVEGSYVNPISGFDTLVAQSRGYAGLDWDDRFGLLGVLDRGSPFPNGAGNPAAPFGQVFLWQRTLPTDANVTLQLFVGGGIRGTTGPAFDYGFDGNGFTLQDASQGPAALVPEWGSGSGYGLDPTDFLPQSLLYSPNNQVFNIFTPLGETLWRDFDFHQTNGLVAARSNNIVVLGDRTQFQGTTNVRTITPPSGKGNAVNQNIAVIHNPCLGEDMIVINDRGNSGIAGTFGLVQFYDLAGNPLTYEVRLPDDSPAPVLNGSNIFSFHWDEPSQTLFIADGNNRDVYALSLDCPCPVDLNADGEVDFFDFLQFLRDFDAGTMSADLTGDGQFTSDDVSMFQAEFDLGCD